MKNIFILVLIVCFIESSCSNPKSSHSLVNETTTYEVPKINYFTVNVLPHDTTLFTEGFTFHNGKLFESSGSPNDISFTNSVIGWDNLQTGTFNKVVTIDKKKYFGEGIAFLKNNLYQLTWLNNVGFIYNATSFKQVKKFNYSTEGWGLTTDGKSLIMDDGSAKIYYLNPINLEPIKVLNVSIYGLRRDSLNELEYINGYIYANIWQTNYIVKIDRTNGKIVGRLDLSTLVNEERVRHPSSGVLNGIAYDSTHNKIYITGKLWQNIYQIDFKH